MWVAAVAVISTALLVVFGRSLDDLVKVAQVATAAVAIYVGGRAWRGEDARLQVVSVDVPFRHRGTSDVLLVTITVFNPSSRGNVAKLVELHRRKRDAMDRNRLLPLKTEPTLQPELDEDSRPLPHTYVTQGALVGSEEVALPAEPIPTVLPLGFAPFETKAITVLRGLSTVDAHAGDMLVVDLYDARMRRTRSRNFLHVVRQRWWTHLVPAAWLQRFANRESRED